MNPDDPVTITLPVRTWQALLTVVPLSATTYTPEGVEVFDAIAAITHAVGGEPEATP